MVFFSNLCIWILAGTKLVERSLPHNGVYQLSKNPGARIFSLSDPYLFLGINTRINLWKMSNQMNVPQAKTALSYMFILMAVKVQIVFSSRMFLVNHLKLYF